MASVQSKPEYVLTLDLPIATTALVPTELLSASIPGPLARNARKQADQINELQAALAQVLAQAASTESGLKEEVARLKAALAEAASTEAKLKDDVETLKTTLTHALSSGQDMRVSARETREAWERVEKELRQENFALIEELGKTSKQLKRVQRELKGKKLVPFMRRLLQERGRLVEVITPQTPPDNREEAQTDNAWVEGSSDVQVIFDGLALQRLERADSTSVVLGTAGAAAFKRRLAPELAALERATTGLQQALNNEIRSAYAKVASRPPVPVHIPRSNFRSARDFRLLVVLWEASEMEQLKETVTSIIGKCTTPKPDRADCLICTEQCDAALMLTVEGCGHMMCKGCFQEYLKVKLAEKVWPVLCPICMTGNEPGKRRQVITRLLVDELTLPAPIMDQWTEWELSQFVIRISCTMCNKPNFYDLTEYNRSKALVCTHTPEHVFCRDCYCPVVPGRDHGTACGDSALERLAGERRWIRCPRPSCRVMVERYEGCDNMTCRCGMYFCYGCGQDIVASSHSSCPGRS